MANPGPSPSPNRAKVVSLYKQGYRICDIVRETGMLKQSVYGMLERAGLKERKRRVIPFDFMPPPPPRVFCDQCERNVLVAEAQQCRSPFCKAERKAA